MDKWNELEANLKARYDVCEDVSATPSSILLAVLNAVADVNRTPSEASPGAEVARLRAEVARVDEYRLDACQLASDAVKERDALRAALEEVAAETSARTPIEAADRFQRIAREALTAAARKEG